MNFRRDGIEPLEPLSMAAQAMERALDQQLAKVRHALQKERARLGVTFTEDVAESAPRPETLNVTQQRKRIQTGTRWQPHEEEEDGAAGGGGGVRFAVGGETHTQHRTRLQTGTRWQPGVAADEEEEDGAAGGGGGVRFAVGGETHAETEIRRRLKTGTRWQYSEDLASEDGALKALMLAEAGDHIATHQQPSSHVKGRRRSRPA